MSETEEILKLIREFEQTNHLFNLAKAQILINELLEKYEFPIEKYKEWLKTESRESCSTI